MYYRTTNTPEYKELYNALAPINKLAEPGMRINNQRLKDFLFQQYKNRYINILDKPTVYVSDSSKYMNNVYVNKNSKESQLL